MEPGTLSRYVHRDYSFYGLLGTGRGEPAQGIHLDFHTTTELCWSCSSFSVALRPHYGLLGTGERGPQDVHLDFHTTPELCWSCSSFGVALRPQRPLGTIRDREPRTATSTFTQLLSSVGVVSARTTKWCALIFAYAWSLLHLLF